MVTKILEQPEIWKIDVSLPKNPLRNLNSYVVRTSGGNLIVDTGFNRPECQQALWEGIEELNLDLAKTSLFITHLHSDHMGLVHDFVARGCTVYMNAIDHDYFDRIKAGAIWPYMEDLFCREGFPEEEIGLQSTENQGRRYAPESIFPAVLVKDGTRLRVGNLEFVCIHTPGHTPGHTVLYLPEAQVLFTGDHILFDITPNISIWKDVPHSLADYLDSLEKIRALPIRVALPAHRAGNVDVYARIDTIIQHHHERLEEIYQAVCQKEADSHTLASRIRWSSRGRPWSEFSPHQKWFAVGETLAHLYYLADQGRVERVVLGDRILYRPR